MSANLNDTHLDPSQLAQLIAGENDSRADLHLRNCEACRNSVAQLGNALQAVASDARRSAERSPVEWSRQRNLIMSRARTRTMRPRLWAAAATLAVMLLAAALFFFTPRTAAPPQTAGHSTPAATTVDEDILLAQVNDALDRDTPAALAPVEFLLQDRDQLLAKNSGRGTKRISNGGSND
jgi:hypothetical protein